MPKSNVSKADVQTLEDLLCRDATLFALQAIHGQELILEIAALATYFATTSPNDDALLVVIRHYTRRLARDLDVSTETLFELFTRTSSVVKEFALAHERNQCHG